VLKEEIMMQETVSQRVRKYFQHPENVRKDLEQRISDIAAVVDMDFAVAKLDAAEQQWNEAIRRQNFPSLDLKEMELDSCRETYKFWEGVLRVLKGIR